MSKISIIGTSHIAKQSINDIKFKFKTDTPELVAIELDFYRAKTIFEKPKKPQLKDVFRLGPTGYLFALVGGLIQRKFGAKVGINPGEDMRTAIKEAKKHKIPIILIDKPITKTLQSISKNMRAWEKLKLASYVLSSLFVPLILPLLILFKKRQKQINLNKVPSENIISDSIAQIKTRFPGLYKSLISDRNKYMARNLKYLIKKNPNKKILVVVGAGHKKYLEHKIKLYAAE